MKKIAPLFCYSKYQRLIVCLAAFVLWSCHHNAQPSKNTSHLLGKGNLELAGTTFQLQNEVYEAYLKMKSAAKEDGIELLGVSGYRSFERQKQIWNRKYTRFTQVEGLTPEKAIDKIITYSTIPGTSRHHWGTDLDVIDNGVSATGYLLDPKKYEEKGPFGALKKWMDEHANAFGFYLVYTQNPSRKGFYYEPWHYTYRPLSQPMLKEYMKLHFREIFKNENVLGYEYMSDAFIEKYIQENILDINPLVK
ncbi:MAG: M15 family metallopeptidase [Flavobacteriaceae bacterium]|nr:M15 family metallopeptidase [Flavobacteriaceae bacterium]